jgi:hypothetical protein
VELLLKKWVDDTCNTIILFLFVVSLSLSPSLSLSLIQLRVRLNWNLWSLLQKVRTSKFKKKRSLYSSLFVMWRKKTPICIFKRAERWRNFSIVTKSKFTQRDLHKLNMNFLHSSLNFYKLWVLYDCFIINPKICVIYIIVHIWDCSISHFDHFFLLFIYMLGWKRFNRRERWRTHSWRFQNHFWNR